MRRCVCLIEHSTQPPPPPPPQQPELRRVVKGGGRLLSVGINYQLHLLLPVLLALPLPLLLLLAVGCWLLAAAAIADPHPPPCCTPLLLCRPLHCRCNLLLLWWHLHQHNSHE